MRQIDNMTPQEIDTLHLKGMISNKAKTSTQQGETFNEKEEHEKDLEHESRQDYATWERDGDTGNDQQGE